VTTGSSCTRKRRKSAWTAVPSRLGGIRPTLTMI
jgi:hypothetical protein